MLALLRLRITLLALLTLLALADHLAGLAAPRIALLALLRLRIALLTLLAFGSPCWPCWPWDHLAGPAALRDLALLTLFRLGITLLALLTLLRLGSPC